jgi:hypothetical protein
MQQGTTSGHHLSVRQRCALPAPWVDEMSRLLSLVPRPCGNTTQQRRRAAQAPLGHTAYSVSALLIGACGHVGIALSRQHGFTRIYSKLLSVVALVTVSHVPVLFDIRGSNAAHHQLTRSSSPSYLPCTTLAGGGFKDWAELLVLSHRPPTTSGECATEPFTHLQAPDGRPGEYTHLCTWHRRGRHVGHRAHSIRAALGALLTGLRTLCHASNECIRMVWPCKSRDSRAWGGCKSLSLGPRALLTPRVLAMTSHNAVTVQQRTGSTVRAGG